MKKHSLLTGAILLLALALFANALVLLLRPGQPATLATPAQAQPIGNSPPGLYYLGRDTYFITANSSGDEVVLWYYDYSPDRRDNRIDYVTSAKYGK